MHMAIASKRWIWEMGNDYRFEYGKWKVNMASRGWIWQGSWWASDGGECARKCFDRCTSHFCPICIQDIDANKNTITYTQKKKKHKYRHKCKYRRDLLSKLALILIWKMETVHLSAKNASCCHYYGDNCLQRPTAVLCNADSGGDTLNMRHLYRASE